jgi:hypothetical protein
MTRDEVHALVMSLPAIEEGTSYGKPSYKLGGKFFTRMRVVDESIVLKMSFDEREMLLEADPEVFFLTDHYAPWPYVLAWIEHIAPDQLRSILTRAWREQAPKKLQKQHPEMAG